MNPEIQRKVVGTFDFKSPKGVLPELCYNLLNQQKKVWKELSDNYKEFENVKYRDIDCGNYNVTLQYNHKRIVSTTAKTDNQSTQNRRCFLCVKNLPEEQKGILWHDMFLILCNPVPIFKHHYTVSHIDHVKQKLETFLNELLLLATDLSPDFTIIYNGPECGASAPDHMHFQAIPRRKLPAENDAVDMKRRKRHYYKNHVALFTLKNYGRTVLIIESSDKSSLTEFLNTLFTQLRKKYSLPSEIEPKMNLLCSFQEDIWRIIIFPRTKHRPDSYFKTGEEQILVSPASIDMGGLIITPREKDFMTLDAKTIEKIFYEVSETPEFVEQVLQGLP